ncbi:hypothetical protein MKQ70_31975 [Chitinophaga sedimenti]|uniref:hypothetical protein n=1 Tax=Chitinophaga sedimenti TaxID=2033606 RepID=UPI0020060BE3|nr:hypothetical protein [Chitinophaga sedimenti]MCK7559336.1 hypothetical protein [Chitinophaga sedimenti]
MNRWIKILFIVIIAVLLTWLYVSPGAYQQRIREINLLLSQKRFPALSMSQQRDFDSIINTIATVSGLKQKVFINQPFDVADAADNGLHFFITDHQTSSFTNCQQGNAVYDAAIKAVFIDISLLRSSDWMSYAPQVGFEILEEDMPF